MKTEITEIVVNGCEGRMGKALLACAAKHPDIKIVGQIDLENGQVVTICPAGTSGHSEPGRTIDECDAVVDFSLHTATLGLLERCVTAGKAMVIGTTGHSEEELSHIPECAQHIPIVKATNFSIGMNTLFWLTRKAAEFLGPDFDLEVVEMHHRLKKDAPSGTAKTLADILAKVRDRQFAEKVHPRQRGKAYKRLGREGNLGERDSSEIGMHSLRGGDVFGDHTVIFATTGERVELTHKASSREAFANGALLAALWVVKQPPGLYSMQNVLGLV